MNPHPLVKSDGFTLLELVTVVTLLSIMSVVVVSYNRSNDTELISQTHILKSHIRYAQARAMNTETQWGVRYMAAQKAYWLFNDIDTNQRIPFPGQESDSVDLYANNLGLDITGGDFTLTFDGWGRPVVTDRAFSSGRLILRLNRGGINGDDITITENTGFIP